jgi:hypothetical protein
MYKAASKAAAGYSKQWSPPAEHLAQLLQLTSSTAARLIACTAAAKASTGSGSSSSSAGSAAGARSSTSNRRRSLSDHDHALYDVNLLDRAPFVLSEAVPTPVGALSRLHVGRDLTRKTGAAARHDILVGMEQFGIMRSPDGPDVDDSLDSQEQASLSALCAALQDSLPQLASLTEVGLRRSAGRPHS